MRVLLVPRVLLLALLAAGCGGGGPRPGRNTGVVTLFTDLSGVAPGSRLRYTLVAFDGREDGAPVADRTVVTDGPSSRVDLMRLPPRTLHLRGVLTDPSGSPLGTVDTLVDGSTASAFSVVRDGAATSLAVLPSAALMRPGESRRFFATAKTQDGALLLAPSGGVAWTSNAPGVAAVDAGSVTGVAEGTTAIAATAGTAAAVKVQATVVGRAPKKWTVLVYLNAANDLAAFSRNNMEQIERIADNPDVRFVVQWKTLPAFDAFAPFQGTRRYLAQRDGALGIGSALLQDMGPNVDMGSPQTLADFVAWGRDYFPADRTILVVWDHGNGWRRNALLNAAAPRSVSGDDERNTEIQTWDLPAALGDAHFAAIVWDASLMQMLEVAYDLRGHADYIVGSEESPPGQGLFYDSAFAALRNDPDGATLDLLKPLVDSTVAAPEYQGRKVTESILDASKLDGLASAVDDLGRALLANRAGLAALVPAVRNAAQAYSPSLGRVYRDLYGVADGLGAGSPVLTNTAEAVKSAVASAVVYEGHTALSPGSHGVSIDFSPGAEFASVKGDYARTGLAGRTRWDDWLAVAP